MSFRLFAWPLFTFTLALSAPAAHAQPDLLPDVQLPKADLENWCQRLKAFCPDEGWKVWVAGNDILIQRLKPVRFAEYRTNPAPIYYPPDRPRPAIPTEEGVFRLRLRFSRLMSLEKYDAIVAENFPNQIKKSDALGIYALDEFLGELIPDYKIWRTPTSAEAFERIENNKRKYRAATKDLVFKPLPTNYSPDYSLTFYQSWRQVQYVYSGDPNVDSECNAVTQAIGSYFGSYKRKDGLTKVPFGLWDEAMKRQETKPKEEVN